MGDLTCNYLVAWLLHRGINVNGGLCLVLTPARLFIEADAKRGFSNHLMGKKAIRGVNAT
jgi:hypothetical protein